MLILRIVMHLWLYVIALPNTYIYMLDLHRNKV